MSYAQDIVRAKRANDFTGVNQRLASVEQEVQGFFKSRGIRTINGDLPQDNGNFPNVLRTTDSYVSSITGTANQVVASAATGAITLSLPQSIATTSTPQFAGLGIGLAAPSTGLSVSAANAGLFSSTSSSSTNYGLRVMIASGAVAGLRIGASGSNGYLIDAPLFAHHFVGQVYASAEIIVGASGSMVTSGSMMNIVASGGYSLSFGSNGSASELFLDRKSVV